MGTASTLFEYVSGVQDNQRDLESATEHLSEYLERDISAENLVDIKQKVQDKYRWGSLFALQPPLGSRCFFFKRMGLSL